MFPLRPEIHRRIFIHRLKGSHSGHHHLMREEARALRAWLKVRGSFPGPIFLSKQKRPIDRTTLHLLMKKYGAAGRDPRNAEAFSCTEALLRHPLMRIFTAGCYWDAR